MLTADIERSHLMAQVETATEPDRIAEIHTRLVDIDAYSAESRAASILSGLGFDTVAQARACYEFLGRLADACGPRCGLVFQPDLLLL